MTNQDVNLKRFLNTDMRLLGDGSKKQYEANLCHSSTCQLTEKKDGDKTFRPIDPAPITCQGSAKPSFFSLFRSQWYLTITYCLVFWTFGMCVAFLGPTLGDLGCRTETPFATMSWVFFAQALFTLIGSVLGGVLVQRVMDGKSVIPGCSSKSPGRRSDWRTVAHMAMLFSLAIMSVTLALVPQCHTLTQLAIDLAVMGLFMGIIDTLANLCMIQLYGEHVAPFLQALHFFYALGAFTSPMINEPFLLRNSKQCFDMIDRLSVQSSNTTMTELSISAMFEDSKIQYGFWIMALLLLPVMAIVLSLIMRTKSYSTPKLYDSLSNENGTVNSHQMAQKSQPPAQTASTRQVVLVTLCVILVCFMYDGLQGAFGGYIFSYTTAMVEGVSSEEAAYLNSCFWGTFAIGRLISIGVATKLSPQIMIVFNIVGCGVAAVVMLMWKNSLMVIYVGTSLFGLALSSVYPTAISLAETYIEISSVVTSMIVVGAAAGEMVQPVIVGHEFSSIGPVMFIVNILLVVLASFMIVFFLLVLGSFIKKRSGFCCSFGCCIGNSLYEDKPILNTDNNFYYYSNISSQSKKSETGKSNNSNGVASKSNGVGMSDLSSRLS